MQPLRVKNSDGVWKRMTPITAQRLLETRRWNGVPACPKCKRVEPIYRRPTAGYFRCPECNLDFTVRTGTLLARSHVPLDKWILAVILWNRMLEDGKEKRKTPSTQYLAREIEVTRKTAELMRRRFWRGYGDDRNDFLFKLGWNLHRKYVEGRNGKTN